MSELSEYFQQIESKFNPSAAKGMQEVFQFDVEGRIFHLAIDDGAYALEEGAHEEPSVTISLKGKTLGGLLDGSVNGMTAFMMGKIKAVGDLMLATKLQQIFSN